MCVQTNIVKSVFGLCSNMIWFFFSFIFFLIAINLDFWNARATPYTPHEMWNFHANTQTKIIIFDNLQVEKTRWMTLFSEMPNYEQRRSQLWLVHTYSVIKMFFFVNKTMGENTFIELTSLQWLKISWNVSFMYQSTSVQRYIREKRKPILNENISVFLCAFDLLVR